MVWPCDRKREGLHQIQNYECTHYATTYQRMTEKCRIDNIRQDLKDLRLKPEDAMNRIKWRRRIHAADPS